MNNSNTQITDTKSSTSLTLFHCGKEKCKPSHSFGPAIRPHYLFHFVLNGSGKYYVDNKVYNVKKGQGFLITPGVTTYYEADEENPWEYCWIGFDGLDVNTILKNCGLDDKSLIFTDKSKGKLQESLINLINTYEHGYGNEYTILGQLYLSFSYMYNLPYINKTFHNETHLQKALTYIHNNYTYDIRITDIANYVGINRSYLFKIFKSSKYMSPLQYLTNYRLNMAKQLLIESDLSITEILYSCGFKNPSSFYKHFKKNMNITPSQYRESFR